MQRQLFSAVFLALLTTINSSSTYAEDTKKDNDQKPKAEAKANPSPEKPNLDIIDLTVYPAPLPRPVLKYRLLPTYLEMTPGNAATLYYRFLLSMNRINQILPDNQNNFDSWLNMPIRELPLQEAKEKLRHYSLRELDYATQRMECDWDLPLRESQSPFEVVVSDMQQCRDCGRIIALNARVQIAQGDPFKALDYLRMGYVLSKHEAQQPIMVCITIGNSIANMMNDQLFELCQDKNAPNLYWTLTSLPHPFINFQRAIDYESVVVLMQFKELLSAKTESHSVEQWQDLWINFIEKYNHWVEITVGTHKNKLKKIDPKKTVKEKYEFVCEQLKTRGWAKKDIEDKAPAHLMLLYCGDLYDDVRDELIKWTAIPYSQLPMNFEEQQKSDSQRFAEKEIVPLSYFAVVNYRIIAGQARVEQTIAVLRTIEALRLYASLHEGKLPVNLEDVKVVPIPLDPWTNKEVSYHLAGETAVISIKYPSWNQAEFSKWATREYHIKIAK